VANRSVSLGRTDADNRTVSYTESDQPHYAPHTQKLDQKKKRVECWDFCIVSCLQKDRKVANA